jgi:hypothetical protein
MMSVQKVDLLKIHEPIVQFAVQAIYIQYHRFVPTERSFNSQVSWRSMLQT